MSKISKRIISVVISVLMLISLMSVFCVPTFAADPAKDFATEFPGGTVDGTDVTLTKYAVLLCRTAPEAYPVTVNIDGQDYNFTEANTAVDAAGTDGAVAKYNANAAGHDDAPKTPQVFVADWGRPSSEGKDNGIDINDSCDLFTPNYNTKPYTDDGYGYESTSYGADWKANETYAGREVVTGRIAVKKGGLAVGIYGFTVDGTVNMPEESAQGVGFNITVRNTVIDQVNTGYYKYETIDGIKYLNHIFGAGGGRDKNTALANLDAISNVESDDSFTVKDCYIRNVKDDGNSNPLLIGKWIPATVILDGLWIPDEVGAKFNAISYMDNYNVNHTFAFRNCNIRGLTPNKVLGSSRGALFFESNMSGKKIGERVFEVTNSIFYDSMGRYHTDSKTNLFCFGNINSVTKITVTNNYFASTGIYGSQFVGLFYFLGSITQDVETNVSENVFNGMYSTSLGIGISGKVPGGQRTFDKNFMSHDYVDTKNAADVDSESSEPTVAQAKAGEPNNYYTKFNFATHKLSGYSADIKEIKVGETTIPAVEGQTEYEATVEAGADEQTISASVYDPREGHMTVAVKRNGEDNATVPKNACNEAQPLEYEIVLTDTCLTENNEKTITLKIKKDHNIVNDGDGQLHPATCTESAYYIKTCSICGEVHVAAEDAAPPTGHDFTKHDTDIKYLKTEANCQSPAVYYVSCSKCGESSKGQGDKEETFEDGVPNPDKHPAESLVTHERVDSTCTAEGHEAYTKCEACGVVTEGVDGGEVIPTKEHGYTAEIKEERYLKEAGTCTTPAVYYKSCANCGESSEGMGDKEATFIGDIDPANHVYDAGVVSKAPTCYVEGEMLYTCTNKCGLEGATKTEVIDPTGHRFKKVVADEAHLAAPATCSQPAQYYPECEHDCGTIDYNHTVSYGEADSSKHVFTKQVKDDAHKAADATYEHGTLYYYSCENCDAIGTATFDAGDKLVKATFPDVAEGSWYAEFVDYASENKLMNGNADGSFNPNGKLTRAEFVQILANLAGVDTTNREVDTGFDDVESGSWSAPAVKWAVDNKIVNGMSPTEFKPNANIERQQICTMVVRYATDYAKVELPKTADKIDFADEAEIADYAKDAVVVCQQAEIVNGMGDNKFEPKKDAERSQAAKIITVFHQLLGKIGTGGKGGE